MGKCFDIDITHYADDDVWAATSEDIKGLTVEAESLQSFTEALIEVSIELLAHNHGLTDAEIGASTVRVKRLRHVLRKTKKPSLQGPTGSRPKLVFNGARELAEVA